MRFEFCGELDCPDWVLAQIQLLSRLTSVKLKLLVNEIIRSLVQDDVNIEKLQSLTAAAKFEEADVRAITAAIEFVLISSAKYDTGSDVLGKELQQLGLPAEHATALCRSYSDKKESIRSVLKDQSFRLSKLKDASVEWKQGVTGDKYSVQLPYAELCLKVERSCVKNTDVLCFTEDRLDEFLDQLKHIRDLMTADQ